MPTAKLVVVIDDDRLTLDAMGGLLRGWGYSVVVAVSDDEAIERLNGRRPDMIISDYHLAEGKTGLQAIDRLRGAFTIPAMLITGNAAAARAQAGRYPLLFKPLDPALLEQALDRAFQDRPASKNDRPD